ncbi:Cerebellar degeneration-related protein 2-like [Nymphon striatum]|nr:Cerebellar degeneration-related protein 2-like [Nymphon striatum]
MLESFCPFIDRSCGKMMGTMIMESDLTPETPTKDWYESDLQLAAELGKTLLERNKELDGSLKQCQNVIDDQELEIQYLTKQVVALREINDSRLKVYEQLEGAIADQERKNSKLVHDSVSDKKVIKSLKSNVEALEKRCEDLIGMVNELRNTHEAMKEKPLSKNGKHWSSNLQFMSSDNKLRRVISCENSIWNCDDYQQASNAETEIIALQSKVNYLKSIRDQEKNTRSELESQMSNLVVENEELREDIRNREQKEQQYKNLEYEMQVFEESYGRACRNCQQRLRLNCGELDSPTSQLLDSDVETENGHELGECTLVRLNNGSTLYGSQESLRSLCNPSSESCSDYHSISLFSELDAQYKALIDKYESLVNTQENETQTTESQTLPSKQNANSSDLDSGINLGDDCATPSAENAEKTVTETVNVCGPNSSLQVRLHTPPRTLNFNSSTNQIQCHFQRSPPEYKKLFQEIFAVLKKTIETEELEKKTPKVEEKKEAKEVVQCSFGHSAQIHRRSYAEVVQSGRPRNQYRPLIYHQKPRRSYYQHR